MKPYISFSDLPSFWITNISKKAISLADLGITIYPMRSINLFDINHYKHLSQDQIIASATSGSLLAKSKYVVVRKVAPDITTTKIQIPLQENAVFHTNQRSIIEIDRVTYDELIIKDEEYADENSDITQEDHLGKWAK